MLKQDAGECDPLLLTDGQGVRPVPDVVDADDQVGEGDLDQSLLDLAVADGALLVRVRHDGAQVAEGDVGQLRHEHRLFPRPWQQHAARYERPEACEALQQHGLADAGGTTDQQRVTRVESQVERVHQVLAVGGAHFDAVDFQRAVRRGGGLHRGERAGTRILLPQPVQANDRRPIACELVVGIAKERQRVVDLTERGGRLHDVAERNLSGEKPWRLNEIGQRVDHLAHGQVPTDEHHHSVQPVAVVVHHRDEPALEEFALGVLTPVKADRGARIPHPHQRVAEARIAKLVEEAQPDQRPPDDERDDGGGEHVDDDDPEQRPVQRDACDRERPG